MDEKRKEAEARIKRKGDVRQGLSAGIRNPSDRPSEV
jgi:hypothetical protein